MAVISPEYLSEKAPSGERKVAEMLREAPGTNDWVVLHSLRLWNHKTKSNTEGDLVLLIPGCGILVMEIKGCPVRRVGGSWEFLRENGWERKESPFEQAMGAAQSLKNFLTEKAAIFSSLLCVHMAVFTVIDFDEDGPEWQPWHHLDRRDLETTQRFVHQILTAMRKWHRHYRQTPNAKAWYSETGSRLTGMQLREIKDLLRPDIELLPTLANVAADAERNIEDLTREQFERAYDAISCNPRVLLSGLAGTGKTHVLLELARRESQSGHKVLFLCFNRLLGNWLQSQTSGLDNVEAAGIHTILRKLANVPPAEVAARKDDSSFWSNDLPLMALENCTAPLFDVLLLDEAQDILAQPDWLDVLDALLKGGLAGGKWVMAGDFSNQAIFAHGRDLISNLEARVSSFARHNLSVNCRNTRKIAAELKVFAGLDPGYRNVLNATNEVPDVSIETWKSIDDQPGLLETVLRRLTGTGAYKPEDIVILSARKDEESCAQRLSGRQHLPFQLVKFDKKIQANNTGYGTVHAFKGLESRVVIITDVEGNLNDEKIRDLLYVGMSRAKISLVMLMAESVKRQYSLIKIRNL